MGLIFATFLSSMVLTVAIEETVEIVRRELSMKLTNHKTKCDL